MSNNRILLPADLIESGFFSDTVLWAVGSPVPDYHFGWLLNHHLGLGFDRKPELDIPVMPGPTRQKPAPAGLFEAVERRPEIAYFAVFVHQIPYTEAHAYLYHNIYGEKRLIPEMRHVDYFFLLPDLPDCAWIQELTKLPKVRWIKQLDWFTVKSKQNFIL